MRVGVEVGGTFTDLVAIEDGAVTIAKVPSVPARPDEGARDVLVAADTDLAAIVDLVHGSTVATNAILERKGAPIAFLVTRGFRDLLLLQRHNRSRIYDLFYRKPKPIVSRADSFEVDERIDGGGEIVTALDPEPVLRHLAAAHADRHYRAVAICLLNAYVTPAHEQRLATLVRERFPDLTVTTSTSVTREFREYERASTTTLAAYVQPVIDQYLKRFEAGLAADGFTGRFSVMQSNGGRMPAEGMAENAITSLFSGPAAGVIGAVRQAAQSGYRDLITFDMGGTSTDVCLVAQGQPQITAETEVDGLPIRTPVLDITTVGAGGGSIVWRDDGGMLRVGPQSSGADPGPACYGRGGEQPTITDAHVIRGTVRADNFLGGTMAIDRDKAHAAFSALADQFGMSLEAISDSALRVAEANIIRAVQVVSTERGQDPRDYTLVPFGGAGPLHAARIAEELGIGTILIPPNAGVLSAFGLLAADFLRFDSRTLLMALDQDAPAKVRGVFAEMEESARADFAAFGLHDDLTFTHSLDMRYVGQAFEVPVAVTDVGAIDAAALANLFAAAHQQLFSFGDADKHKAEIVSFRLGTAAPPGSIPSLSTGSYGQTEAEEITSRIFDQGAHRDCRILARQAAAGRQDLTGPMLLEDGTSTIYVPEGWGGKIDDADNLILTVDSA
jgi:N-methylhydantoinase A